MKWRLFAGLTVLLLVLVGVMSTILYSTLLKPLPIQSEFTYQVKQGSYLYAVLNDLKDKNIVKNVRIARWYAKLAKLENIKAGEFLVKPDINLIELLNTFNSHDVIQYRVTLIDGLRFRDYLALIQTQPKIKSVINQWTDEQIMAAIGAKEVNPEGLFAPETYSYTAGQSDIDLLTQSYQRQQQIIQDAWSKRSEDTPLKTPYEALILASIVEKETGSAGERNEISGVFSRRLHIGMRLQSDPTTIYGLGDRYKGNLISAHLKEKNAYNTYRINGLPVTPIANPGAAAIYAATNPAKGETLYFVAKGDGSHYFSKTLSEHSRAVRKYQIFQRSKNYQSNPEELTTNE